MHRQVFNTCAADLAQQHGNAVDIGFRPDDADVRVLGSLMHQMLAATKPDFEPDRALPEQCGQIQRRTRGVVLPGHKTGGQGGQILGQIGALAAFQGFTLQAAIKIAMGAISHGAAFNAQSGRGQWWQMAFRTGARSRIARCVQILAQIAQDRPNGNQAIHIEPLGQFRKFRAQIRNRLIAQRATGLCQPDAF